MVSSYLLQMDLSRCNECGLLIGQMCYINLITLQIGRKGTYTSKLRDIRIEFGLSTNA